MVVALAATGCGLENQLRKTFTVEQSIPEQVIPGDPIGLMGPPQALPPIALNMESEDGYKDQVEQFDLVVRVSIRSLQLRITPSSDDPAIDGLEDDVADDFSFLEWVEIFVEATVDGGLLRERVAVVEPGSPQLEPGGRELNFTCTGADVSAILTAEGGYRLVVQVTGRLPVDDVIFDGSLRARVTVAADW